VTYWIARPHWGQGHASRALALVLDQAGRPLLARVASDNLGSRRVLEKAGFDVVGSNRDYAPGRHAETDELILRLN
jgi:RimJ/RimL family protein N-acetyltransferase